MSVYYAIENDIHNAMSLPSRPADIPLGTTPKGSKENLIKWMDKMMKSVSRPECLVVDEGLRPGERGKAIQKLQTMLMQAWHHKLYQVTFIVML